MYDYTITTITACITPKVCIELNLYNIATYIEIGDEIIGLKYLVRPGKLLVRGKYNGKLTSFHNQVSLVIQLRHKRVNVKIFKNASIQITGCKSTSDAWDVYTILQSRYTKLDSKFVYKEIVENEQGVILTDDNTMVVSKALMQVIGWVDDEEYVIRNTRVKLCNDNNVFMTTKGTNRMIIDSDGETIASTTVNLYNGYKKLYKNKSMTLDYILGNITVNGEIIGKISSIPISHCELVRRNEIGELNYSCSPFLYQNSLTRYGCDNLTLNVNCINIVVKTCLTIDRQNLYEKLLQMNKVVLYNPNSYSAVRLMEDVVVSDTVKYTISILIFQSGNIIISGIRSIEIIDDIVNDLHVLLETI
jgi:TATA-box binding protein (TBP) (component of TFIID and TFIIIB)